MKALSHPGHGNSKGYIVVELLSSSTETSPVAYNTSLTFEKTLFTPTICSASELVQPLQMGCMLSCTVGISAHGGV